MNGLPTYSVAFVASRQMPLTAAMTKPVVATGTVGLLIAGRATLRHRPTRRRSRISTEPKSVATPRMWTRFTTPYVHTPDSRIAWPRAEACNHAMNSYKTVPWLGLLTIGIDVESAAVPDYPFGLDLETVCVPIAMTMDRYCGPYRDDPFLQSCPLGPGRWSQYEIPEFSVSAELHRSTRSGQAGC